MSNLEELKKIYLEKQEEQSKYADMWLGGKSKDAKKKVFAIDKELKQIREEVEKELGFIWNYDNWVTAITSNDNLKTMEEARQDLFDKIKDLNGVTIISDKKGIKSISVLSTYKVYNYTINCHYASKVVGQVEDKNIFTGETYLKDIYETVYVATLSPLKYSDGTNSAWRNNESFEKLNKLLKEN